MTGKFHLLWFRNLLAPILSVDYEATAHISEEVKRASYAAPAAIVIGKPLVQYALFLNK